MMRSRDGMVGLLLLSRVVARLCLAGLVVCILNSIKQERPANICRTHPHVNVGFWQHKKIDQPA